MKIEYDLLTSQPKTIQRQYLPALEWRAAFLRVYRQGGWGWWFSD